MLPEERPLQEKWHKLSVRRNRHASTPKTVFAENRTGYTEGEKGERERETIVFSFQMGKDDISSRAERVERNSTKTLKITVLNINL